jgi:hypothetical protein
LFPVILGVGLHKLEAIEEAKRLFEEAKDWGVWRWLTEKWRARQTADAAWAAFDRYEAKVKALWSEDLQKACREVEAEAAAAADSRARRSYEKANAEARHVDAEIKAAMRR